MNASTLSKNRFCLWLLSAYQDYVSGAQVIKKWDYSQPPPPSFLCESNTLSWSDKQKKIFSFYVISVADAKVMQKKRKRKVQNDHIAFLQRQQIAHLKKGGGLKVGRG